MAAARAFYIQTTLMAAISDGSSLACCAEAHRSSMAIIAMPRIIVPNCPGFLQQRSQSVNHSISQIQSTEHSFKKRWRGMKVLYKLVSNSVTYTLKICGWPC